MSKYLAQNSINNQNKELWKIVERVIQGDYSSHTKKAITSDLRCFEQWYREKNKEEFSFSRCVQKDVQDFRDERKKNGYAVSTINRKIISLKMVFAEAKKQGLIESNIVEDIKRLSEQSLAPRGLTQPETRKLLKEVELRGNTRDRVIVELLVYSGIRVSELISLTPSDISITERKGFLEIQNGKGAKKRKVPLSKQIRELLSIFLENNSSNISKTDQLFQGQRGPLTAIAINKILEKYSPLAGSKISPHTLRHTFAYSYLKSNPEDIVGLSQILGHSNINTTARYTQNRLEDLQKKAELVRF